MKDKVAALKAEIETLALTRNWSVEEKAHAISACDEGISYKDEIRITLANGRVICCPSYPQDCNYVRILDQGFELVYWVTDPEGAPMVYMGPNLGVVRGDGI